MGMGAVDSVAVALLNVNESIPVVIDRDTLEFDGLSSSGYAVDADTAFFRWVPGTSAIGVVRMEVDVASISGEPDDDDNSVEVPFLIDPRDYATEVLEDPWDMTEAPSCSVAWHTYDIRALTGYDSTFSDSVSGMFEGTVVNPSRSDRLILNTGTGASDYIDSDMYSNFSLAARADRALDLELCWVNSNDDIGSVDTGEELTSDWETIGPIDIDSLSSRWDDYDIRAFWLEFGGSNLNTDVRIGWIKLAE
jgi:hypothetical protein